MASQERQWPDRLRSEAAKAVVGVSLWLAPLVGLILAVRLCSSAPDTEPEAPQPASAVASQRASAPSTQANLPGQGTVAERAAYADTRRASDSQFRQAHDFVALIINSNGHLCGRITDVRPLRVEKGEFEVTCVERRGGSNTVRYLVNGETMAASRL